MNLGMLIKLEEETCANTLVRRMTGLTDIIWQHAAFKNIHALAILSSNLNNDTLGSSALFVDVHLPSTYLSINLVNSQMNTSQRVIDFGEFKNNYFTVKFLIPTSNSWLI